MRLPALALLAALPLLAAPARAGGEPAPDAAPAAAPAWSVAASLGSASAYGDDYLVLGARVSRALALGLSADLHGQLWLGGAPRIGKLAPGLTFTAPAGLYVGGYYARWIVGAGHPDLDALGARGGLRVARTGAVAVSVGAAYERILSCRVDCESWWPEAVLGVRF